MGNKFYITTAIDYANATPHLGTAYEKIGADIIARFKRLQGFDVLFQMGNDEHSLNVEKKAKEEGLDPVAYCDKMAERFEAAWAKLNISYDRFIRTTHPEHEASVQALLKRIHERGDIYKGHYEGWYCISCEAFYSEGDLADGKCPVHKRDPEWIKEENYFFALSRYAERIRNLIIENPKFVRPEARRNEILSLIEKEGLKDISISRGGTKWGIPIPFDTSQVVYVWVDALINYVTGAGFPGDMQRFEKYWPADLHVIGKDITRFHCVIWPAMLMSAGIEPPLEVFGHGFVGLSGAKMSKTAGTILDPIELAKKYGADPMRYFLFREIPFDRDGDFSIERLERRYEADLANDLGNLLNRVITLAGKHRDGRLNGKGPSSAWRDVPQAAGKTFEGYVRAMESYELHIALGEVWNLAERLNKFVDEAQPWSLAKDPQKKDELEGVLYACLEGLRVLAVLLYPFTPEASSRIWHQLGIEKPIEHVRLNEAGEWGGYPEASRVQKGEILFPRLHVR